MNGRKCFPFNDLWKSSIMIDSELENIKQYDARKNLGAVAPPYQF